MASVLTGMGLKARASQQGNPGAPQLQLLPPDHDWRGVCPVAGWKRHPGEKSKSIRGAALKLPAANFLKETDVCVCAYARTHSVVSDSL